MVITVTRGLKNYTVLDVAERLRKMTETRAPAYKATHQQFPPFLQLMSYQEIVIRHTT